MAVCGAVEGLLAKTGLQPKDVVSFSSCIVIMCDSWIKTMFTRKE